MEKQFFKMRAECAHDLGEFLMQVSVLSFKAEQVESNGTFFPDMTVEFSSTQTLAEIKAHIATIVDGHVMLETVALSKDYTGNR